MFDEINQKRQQIYELYRQSLQPLEEAQLLRMPRIPEDCVSNHHMFYILLPSRAVRDGLMAHLKQQQISAVFHYIPLHSSPVGQSWGFQQGDLPVTEHCAECLLRLPFYYELTPEEQLRVISEIEIFLTSLVCQSLLPESLQVKNDSGPLDTP